MISVLNHQLLLNGNNIYNYMKIFKILFFILGLHLSIAQTVSESYIKHTVVKGETVFQLSKKYQVTPYDIYQLNPDARSGIQENAIILIPAKNNDTVSKVVNTSKENDTIITKHKVKRKETLYTLAKQYSVSVMDLEEWNPEVKKKGLKKGREIIVKKEFTPKQKDIVEVIETQSTTTYVTHVVKPQETLYGLTKQYNISEETLKTLNPQLKDGLKSGDTLRIKQISEITTATVNEAKNAYVVKSQETIYGITKQFSISEEALLQLNPQLKDGLKEGMILRLPNAQLSHSAIKPKANLRATLDLNSRKEVVLLLPFNLSKIQADTIKTSKDYIQKSKLLNVALDFYSGAKIAIDSARQMGLPVTVKIINVETGKMSSNISSIIQKHHFTNTSAVIGPFINSHAEAAALLLKEYNVPVISPLSKELSKPISNLYNAVPTEEKLISGFIEYMNRKDGNIVAVVSAKKESSKTKLRKHTEVKFVSANEKEIFTIDGIRLHLTKDKKNFVILESEVANQILSVTNSLLKLTEEGYNIQLATLEVNETYNFEEIKMENLIKLQLLYPSVTKEPTTIAEKVVIKKLRNANKTTPNNYVLKGFDVTFDTLLRVCQQEGFATTTQELATEGVANGFNYITQNGVHLNNKIYIQYYDTDYTIKTTE